MSVPLLSTGQPSTLGTYKTLVVSFFGVGSAPDKFIDEKIAESPNGEDEVVIADETQMLYLFGQMIKKEVLGE